MRRNRPRTAVRQPQLPFPRKGLWQSFPETTQAHCRELLAQWLRQVVLRAPPLRRDHE
jgi:hypothetical protein